MQPQGIAANRPEEPSWKRRWAWQIGFLASIALLVFAGFYLLDHFVSGVEVGGGQPEQGPLERYFDFDPGSITDAVSSLAGMIAAVLGIVITVVSIVVQLSSDRYTGVAEMFLKDRINIAVMAFYVIAAACGVWLSVSLKAGYVARATLLLMMAATTFGLVLMLPYFAYVFWFLEPGNIVRRIRRDAVATVAKAAAATGAAECTALQAPTLNAMQELTDITSNSISGKDKIIASRAVDALKDFAIEYLAIKKQLAPAWFVVGQGIHDDPDFVAMERESLQDLERRRTWVEWQVLRQYLGIYNEALATMRDINYLIAIDTRYVGEAACRHGDDELVELVFRFMNSYMRATLNARDVRTAYNVLNQYRMLVEAMLEHKHGRFALEGVKHMMYYGHLSFDMKLTFVTETVAYDISSICQLAHTLAAPEQDALLAAFLDLDRPLHTKSQEKGLLGVRKAQVKLAAYFLLEGEEEKARMIARDMADEPRERLLTIRHELERVTSKDFWEIIDRGRNFEYMPPDQRAQMATFFEWLGMENGEGSSSSAREA